MIISAANNLQNNYEYIDALNVFPVPDGDTGTNMNLTMNSGAQAVKNLANSTFKVFAQKLSHGLLMGARGNSGVILSQFFRGFCEIIINVTDEVITLADFVKAFEKGSELAYASVLKPVEGTILTITSYIAAHLKKLDLDAVNDVVEFFQEIKKVADETTQKTIDMLDVLKNANTIDSGAKGLAIILEGFLRALENKPIEAKNLKVNQTREYIKGYLKQEEEFGFCTEMLIKLKKDVLEKEVRKELFDLGGSSIVVAKSEDLLKLHAHVLFPLNLFEYGMQLGEIVKLKSENMTMQSKEMIINEKNKKPELNIAVVSISWGPKISSELYDSGAYAVHDATNGAPTVDDFINLAKSAFAKTVIILPNDKNFILAAEQAKKQESNIRIRIIESKSVVEGLAALTAFDVEQSLRTNSKEMRRAIKKTKCLECIKAVKNANINNVLINKGSIILKENGRIIKAGKSEVELIKEYVDNEKQRSSIEFINVIFGVNFDHQMQSKIINELNKYKLAEKKLITNAHPVYSLIIGFE